MMQATNSFDIQTDILPHGDTDLVAYLADLFSPGSKNYDQLKYEIQREYRFSGSPEVTSVMFDRAKFDAASGKGSFRVVLDINFTFGCEDVLTEKTGQTSEWTFAANPAASVIHFYGSPYADSRSTANEF